MVNVFLMTVGLAESAIVTGIFFIPCFFICRRFYKKRFKDDRRKALVWTVFTSIILAPFFFIVLIFLIAYGLVAYESIVLSNLSDLSP